ncbi:MAG: hypothetical protein AAFP84_22695, partial [Actinomycetota bacterium]
MAEIETLTDGTAANGACGDLFRADALGCNRVTTSLDPGRPAEVLRVHDGADTLGAAVAVGGGFTLTPLRGDAADLIADALPLDRRLRVVGEPGDVATIAGRWSERCDGAIDTGRLFRWYRLDDPHPRKKRGGSTRVAGRDRIDHAAGWGVAFADEIGVPRTLDEATKQMSDATNESRLIEWIVAEQTVSQLVVSPARFGVVRINGLYTPPELRKEGHSGTLVIEVAAQQIARQKVDQVVVEVPAADGVLNRMYRRL